MPMVHSCEYRPRPNVNEFKRFYALLMSNAPEGYIPFLFPLEQRGKDPLLSRGSWTAEKNRLSYDDAIRFLEYGFNVGISARDYDPLVLIDIDDMAAVDDIKQTLSVITRSRVGTHNYYFSDDPDCNVNIPTDYGEIRSCNQYLVAPGSYVTTDTSNIPLEQLPYAGFYTVLNDVAPTTITFNEFPKVFKDQHNNTLQNIPPRKTEPSGRKGKSALFSLSIVDVVHCPMSKKRFASVFHGSDTGSNTSVSGGLLHCWRHLVSHTPLQALSVLSGVYTCQQAGRSHRNGGSGESMLDISDGKTMWTIWRYARDNHIIPPDDVPPRCVVLYVAEHVIGFPSEYFEDGWKLPQKIYDDVIEIIRECDPSVTHDIWLENNI